MKKEISNKPDPQPPIKRYTGEGAFVSPIDSNAMVVGNMNSQFKYNQSTDGPYQEMSKGASMNKYLVKIAMSKLVNTGMKALGDSSHISKIGLGMSATGLGISAANFHNTRMTAKSNVDRHKLERKSLTALNNINKSLSTAQLHPSPVATNIISKKL